MTIELDGSMGEGGGQILRTALSLSMLTGKPIRITKIRAGRKKPGLMRQHLTAVNAAARVCSAHTDGAHLGSTQLSFTPGSIRGGEHTIAIGSAGSCTLVLQTLLPALLFAPIASRLTVQGGTHNPMAPCYHFLERAFVPLLHQMGANIQLRLNRFGFYPAGGGEVVVEIAPVKRLSGLRIESKGARRNAFAESFCAGIPANVGQRELEEVESAFKWPADCIRMRGVAKEQGPGNALVLTFEHEHITEVFTALGEKGLRAEAVAQRAIADARHWMASEGAVGTHLADQLLLPLALAGDGAFTTTAPTPHTLTNAQVIECFLDVRFELRKVESGIWLVRIGSSAQI